MTVTVGMLKAQLRNPVTYALYYIRISIIFKGYCYDFS